MKPKLTLLFTLLYLAAFPQTEWAPIGAEWYYTYREDLVTPATGYYHLKSVKDTVIDSKQCKVIYKTLVDSKGDLSFEGEEYLYSDTIENKVYRYLYGSFYLLYDFNKEKGDTIIVKEPYSTNNYDSIVVVVDSVSLEIISDTLQLKSLYVQKIHKLSSNELQFGGKIIEKMGNYYYFFPYNGLDCDGGCPQPLRCYNDDKVNYISYSPYYPYYPYAFPCDTFYTYSGLITGMDTRIYPNPFKDFLSIEVANNSAKPFSVEVLNSSGQTVFQDKLFSGKCRVNLSMCPRGIYFIKLFNKEKEVIKKLIKL